MCVCDRYVNIWKLCMNKFVRDFFVLSCYGYILERERVFGCYFV